jgi:hypothetical protein
MQNLHPTLKSTEYMISNLYSPTGWKIVATQIRIDQIKYFRPTLWQHSVPYLSKFQTNCASLMFKVNYLSVKTFHCLCDVLTQHRDWRTFTLTYIMVLCGYQRLRVNKRKFEPDKTLTVFLNHFRSRPKFVTNQKLWKFKFLSDSFQYNSVLFSFLQRTK